MQHGTYMLYTITSEERYFLMLYNYLCTVLKPCLYRGKSKHIKKICVTQGLGDYARTLKESAHRPM